MGIRQAVRAGTFYDASPQSCRRHAGKLFDAARLPEDLPGHLFGGLVPHAGWTYSGRLAAMTFKALNERKPLETVVLLGADHVGTVRQGEVYESGTWESPLGQTAVDEEFAAAVIEAGQSLRPNGQAHAKEHSLEVQIPLLQAIAPSARIVPIAVPPSDQSVEIGRVIGRIIAERFPSATVVGSTDLTHHGGGRFPAPGGRGDAGEKWTRSNDRRMLDLIESMDAEEVVPEAAMCANACGAGAIAATVAACREMGATRGLCLEYTNSYQVVRQKYPYELDDTTVGYASVVFT